MPMSPPQRGIGFDSKIFSDSQPEIAHPLRLALHLRNLRDDLRVQALAGP